MDDDIIIISTTKGIKPKANNNQKTKRNLNSNDLDILITDISEDKGFDFYENVPSNHLINKSKGDINEWNQIPSPIESKEKLLYNINYCDNLLKRRKENKVFEDKNKYKEINNNIQEINNETIDINNKCLNINEVSNKEIDNKIHILLKNRRQYTPFYLSIDQNFKKVFDTIILGDKKIFFKGSIISKFSTPKILQMSTSESNILEVMNPEMSHNGLFLKINVSSNKRLESYFKEDVTIEDVFEYIKSEGIEGKTKLIFNGSIILGDDLSGFDDGYCIDAV